MPCFYCNWTQFFFENVLQRTGSFYDLNGFLFKICSNSEYADEYAQLASSLLLKRSVYCYSLKSNGSPNNFEYCCFDENIGKQPLLVVLEKNHFSPVLAINSNLKSIKPNQNQFKKFKVNMVKEY